MNGSLPRRRVLRAVAAVTAAGLLGLAAACGAGSTGEASDELVYWSMWKAGEPQAKVLESAIGSFTEETGVKVKVEWKGRDVAKQLAPTLNTRNVPADLVDSADRFVKSTFFATGQGLDLSPVYDLEIPGESGKKVGDVIAAKYREYATTEGRAWLVPYEVLAEQIWYDGGTLQDVAAAPPKTWDDFVSLLAARKAARGDGPLALDADIADYSAFWTYHAVLRDLGPGAFGAAATDTTGAKFDDPAFVAAVQKIEKLVKDGYFVKGYDGSKYPAVQQKWAAGGADFLLLGTFAPSETKPSAKEGFQYRSFPFPAGARGEQTQEISLIGFAIPARARNAEAAKKFIAYFMNRERLSKIATEADNITPRTDVEAPAMLADVKKTLDTARTHPALDGVKMDHTDWYTKVFQPANTELITGKVSAAEFVAKLKSTSVDFWKLNG
ncbi:MULTISPECIES: ABC transporter substrate-binding protein [Streptosporangium]|uniref:Raffinose/stachyose/melibiose transport system substrate-binding protein n=1 Tax=Streptosporangium brasiliense TaxID=47480 RepID=A0ABT9RH19_9ACTN|nr:extracellular solute-binding protein [Streptosporangium brasiliense]MDP9868009.1 raffinose/stachyose/melibiose transport system substrate-binding protein [Streptosporangium brasiliense]